MPKIKQLFRRYLGHILKDHCTPKDIDGRYWDYKLYLVLNLCSLIQKVIGVKPVGETNSFRYAANNGSISAY